RTQMLDEIHLVHVAFEDRRAHRLDRPRVVVLVPRRTPPPDRVVAAVRPRRVERVCNRRQAARLRCARRGGAVRDEDARDVERLLGVERGFELPEGHDSNVRAAWRNHARPSSRSSIGMRSSAEWMIWAISSGCIRIGKKPYATVPNASR